MGGRVTFLKFHRRRKWGFQKKQREVFSPSGESMQKNDVVRETF
jgi:hypothetical protein